MPGLEIQTSKDENEGGVKKDKGTRQGKRQDV